MDGLAELPATLPGSEQGISLSVRGDVRVGLQRQAGDRGVRAGAIGCAVCHHLPYMSQDFFLAISAGLGTMEDEQGLWELALSSENNQDGCRRTTRERPTRPGRGARCRVS